MSRLTATIRRAGIKTGDYTVTRYAAGTTTLGVFTPGGTSTFLIAASIQPYKGREIKIGPEGQQGDDVRMVFTETELRATAGTPDTILYKSQQWKVFECEDWAALGGVHYRAFIARPVST